MVLGERRIIVLYKNHYIRQVSSNEQNVFEVVERSVRVFEQTTQTQSQKITLTHRICQSLVVQFNSNSNGAFI